MLNVGLTGGIASGKSTVVRMFGELGALSIDLDLLAHAVYEPGGAAWPELVAHFGREILNEDQSINRERLAARVFSRQEEMEVLNSIVHPLVLTKWRQEMETIREEKPEAVVLSDMPLLFETGLEAIFDVVILVYLPREEQLKRLTLRNGLSASEAQKRLAAQIPMEEKVKKAEIIIDNSGSINQTRERVRRVWDDLLQREKKGFCL